MFHKLNLTSLKCFKGYVLINVRAYFPLFVCFEYVIGNSSNIRKLTKMVLISFLTPPFLCISQKYLEKSVQRISNRGCLKNELANEDISRKKYRKIEKEKNGNSTSSPIIDFRDIREIWNLNSCQNLIYVVNHEKVVQK